MTSCRKNFSGNVDHVNIFNWIMIIIMIIIIKRQFIRRSNMARVITMAEYSFNSRVRVMVRISFSVCLVSGYAHRIFATFCCHYDTHASYTYTRTSACAERQCFDDVADVCDSSIGDDRNAKVSSVLRDFVDCRALRSSHGHYCSNEQFWHSPMDRFPNSLMYAKPQIWMLNISFNLLLCLVYFAKNVEDWFGYGTLNILSYKCLTFVLIVNINNGQRTITTHQISTT